MKIVIGLVILAMLVGGYAMYQSWGNQGTHEDLQRQIKTLQDEQTQISGRPNSSTTRDWSKIGVDSVETDSADTETEVK
ncbi:MAG: hypothetical protein COY66_04530 [Candidatus Kerfeldbacteria bacterium CG_4_10_14_0_8_um_filter_42_10]|uniref:Uncharacterized protein n=1 Tax=Candidatus Kerfeldbacteria bacterium CG_4_10_14_0_8_um_filter_42_10 TaxID=2014248 RepID=A0A2M7RHN8_9BACT|nr:MAG: hypothetical protein COY66_04530 [Candidatus Kerfeldbacteria bacterium CG_4_10_14_0_8_um_filter_42_10]